MYLPTYISYIKWYKCLLNRKPKPCTSHHLHDTLLPLIDTKSRELFVITYCTTSRSMLGPWRVKTLNGFNWAQPTGMNFAAKPSSTKLLWDPPRKERSHVFGWVPRLMRPENQGKNAKHGKIVILSELVGISASRRARLKFGFLVCCNATCHCIVDTYSATTNFEGQAILLQESGCSKITGFTWSRIEIWRSTSSTLLFIEFIPEQWNLQSKYANTWATSTSAN